MRSRREFLAGSGVIISGAIAGCGSLISDDEPEYSIRVYNHGNTSRTFHIRIGERLEEYFLTETVELREGSASDTISVDGVPGVVSTTIDEGDQWGDMLYAWPVQAGGGAPASDVWMSFWPDRKQNLYVRPVGDGAFW